MVAIWMLLFTGPTQVLVGRPRDMRDLPARATSPVQAGQLGRTSMPEPQAVTDPYAAKLATVYDKEIEVAARDACHRDYLAFGFGDWRPR